MPCVAPTTSAAKPKLLTYRFKNALCYVTIAPTYEEAIQYAVHEFRELDDAKLANISIYVTVTIRGQQSKARISAMAWPEVAPNLASFEVLDIVLEQERSRPNPRVIVSDAPDLPPYTPDEKSGYEFLDASSHSESTSMRPRSPSPSIRSRSSFSRVIRWGKN